MYFDEIRRQPRKEEPHRPVGDERGEQNRPNRAVAQQRSPPNRRRRDERSVAHGRRRFVDRCKPQRHPRQADDGIALEDRAPAVAGGDPRRQRQRDERSRMYAGHGDRRRARALLDRKPTRDEVEDRGHVDALPQAEGQSSGDERSQTGGERGETGDRRPQEHRGAEHSAAAEAVREPPARQVRSREPVEEYRLQQTDRGLVPAVFLHQQRRRDREVPAVHVGERHAGAGQGGERVPRGPHGRGVLTPCSAARQTLAVRGLPDQRSDRYAMGIAAQEAHS